MSRREPQEPVVLHVEYQLGELPVSLQWAIRFANAHDKRVVIGYVEDEKKAYLMTVDVEDA